MVTGGDDMEPSVTVFVSTCLPHHRGNPQTMVDFMRRMEAKHNECYTSSMKWIQAREVRLNDAHDYAATQ